MILATFILGMIIGAILSWRSHPARYEFKKEYMTGYDNGWQEGYDFCIAELTAKEENGLSNE